MGAILRALYFVIEKLSVLGVVGIRFGQLIGALARILGSVFGHPAAWFFMCAFPMLDFLIELLTGHRGIISSVVQGWITKGCNLLLGLTFHVNLQDLIDKIPQNVSQYCCYLGLNAALQSVFDGVITAMTIIISYEMTLILFRIKTYMATRSILGRRR